jgi:nitrate/TMAO reductase-like tetraheme cytochrome c subunit
MTTKGRELGIVRVTAIIIFAALVVVAIAFAGVYTWASTPGFCNVCHIMKTRYVSWNRSAHWNKASCIQCHSEPGTLGEIKAHLQGARYLYSLITGARTRTVLRAEVSNASCARCHESDKLGFLVRGHDPNHATHLELGINCAQCHDNLVHGTLGGDPSRSYMASCQDCHRENDPATLSCTTCHSHEQLATLINL